MCLMGGKAESHPCSHKGENIKCSKNNHQHFMHIQSLSRWERRYLNHWGLPSAWWMKLSIVCKPQMDRESIKSPLLIFWLFIALSNPFCFILRWCSLIPSASPCVGFKAGGAGSSAAPGRQMSHGMALAQRLLHPWLHTDVLLAGAAVLCREAGRGTIAPSWGLFSFFHVALSGANVAPTAFERRGYLWWLFCLQLLRASSLSIRVGSHPPSFCSPSINKSNRVLKFCQIFVQIVILPLLHKPWSLANESQAFPENFKMPQDLWDTGILLTEFPFRHWVKTGSRWAFRSFSPSPR